MEILIQIIIFFFGACIGSFLNVVILRLPNEESLEGRSHCMNCKHQLAALDLLPCLSFVFLRGRCRYCKQKISPRYFIIELITAGLFLFAWQFIKPHDLYSYLLLVKYAFLAATLLVIFVIDLEHYLILDIVLLPAGVITLILNLFLNFTSHQPILALHSYFVSGIFAALLAVLPFFLIWYFSKGAWMGFGDVKLAIFLGLALGLPLVFVCLMLGVLLGGAVSVVLLVFSQKTMKSQVPFGTFLSFAAVLTLFYGEKVLSWYLAFLNF